MAKEHLHELEPRPTRSTLDILVHALGKLDNIGFGSPMERAKHFQHLLSLEGKQVLDAIPTFPERAVR